VRLIAALLVFSVLSLVSCSYRDKYREDKDTIDAVSIDLAMLHSYVVTEIRNDPNLTPQEKAEKLALWIEMRKRVYKAQTGVPVIIYHDDQFYAVSPDGHETEVRWLLWITAISNRVVE
jgi:hypothetical protein